MMPPDPRRFRVWHPDGLGLNPRQHESGRLGKSLRLSGSAPVEARWKWTLGSGLVLGSAKGRRGGIP